MLDRVANLFRNADIRKRIWITFGFLLVYRIGSNVPIPGVNVGLFKALTASRDSGNQFLAMLNLLSGGAVQGAALFSLGIMPYISASIIFSLLVKVVPRLEAVAKEGNAGQRRINQWTRLATVPLAVFQSIIVFSNVYRNPGFGSGPGMPTEFANQTLLSGGFGALVMCILALTAGTIFLMWIGEQITEHGVGNGISLLIMAGIIARLPENVHQLLNTSSPITPVLLFVLFLAVVVVVVYITKGTRRIPVQYARLVRGRRGTAGGRSYMPVKVNQAGVMPVVFSSSLLAFPALLAGGLGWGWLQDAMRFGGWWYTVLDVGLIYFFSYFWTSLMFNPAEVSKNMKESGAFIPGIRPGRTTAEFLERVMVHMTLAGATFLAIMAIVPSWLAREANSNPQVASFLGGTSILIVVSVALDLVDKLNSQLMTHHYESILHRRGRG
jgi:preprotein translocase subunit SecY